MITNPLAGKALRYLIGADSPLPSGSNVVTALPYGKPRPNFGLYIGYCNLFDEENAGRYGPYLHDSDTAEEYNEGQIDPRGPGWRANLHDQFKLRKEQGFQYVELDNPDAYSIEDVIGAIGLADEWNLKVIAKNPLLMNTTSAARMYLADPNVHGAIVEKGAGNPRQMDELRRAVGKPELPVWFVAFGKGRSWANDTAKRAANYFSMGVTYCADGEYKTARDILVPRWNVARLLNKPNRSALTTRAMDD